LARRGLEPGRADVVVRGLGSVALLFDAVDGADREGLDEAAKRLGLECLTGDGWALLSGSAAALAGLIRTGASPLPADTAAEIGRLLRSTVEPPTAWEMARGTIHLERPVVVGIVNVTPDSFSDGGRFLNPEDAVAHAERLVADGAAMIDLGGESTRPGVLEQLPPAEEWRRLEPVLGELARRFPSLPVSVDTVNHQTGRRALELGAWALNDVSGLRLDADIASVCAEHGAGLVLMHSRGHLSEMATYEHAEYDDVATEVAGELQRAIGSAEARGLGREHIVLDPGLGFAKRPEHNYAVLRGLTVLTALGFPVMVGPSRKRFLGQVIGTEVSERDNATAAACVAAYSLGATLFRVHDVHRVREALQIAHAIRDPVCPSSNSDI
jgi:dihydropteroate synthase